MGKICNNERVCLVDDIDGMKQEHVGFDKDNKEEVEKDDFLMHIEAVDREWEEFISSGIKVAAQGEVKLDFTCFFDVNESAEIEEIIVAIGNFDKDEFEGNEIEVNEGFSNESLFQSSIDESHLISDLDSLSGDEKI